ncbi:hypothetical protein ACSBR1_007358 [Camellia fascicularis]
MRCPFCKTLNYAVEYRGVKTKEEKGIEQIEEQRVIEAKIRMWQQELQDEELRMLTRQEISSSSRSMLPGEVGYSTGEVDEEIVSSQIPLRQSLRPRQNSFVLIESAPEGALVTQVPGLNDTFPSKHYSGYVTIDEAHGKKLFYYFVLSEAKPSRIRL